MLSDNALSLAAGVCVLYVLWVCDVHTPLFESWFGITNPGHRQIHQPRCLSSVPKQNCLIAIDIMRNKSGMYAYMLLVSVSGTIKTKKKKYKK